MLASAPSVPDRALILLYKFLVIGLLIGPAIGAGPLKLFHPLLLLLTLITLLFVCLKGKVARAHLNAVVLLFSFLSIVVSKHALDGAINTRYLMYLTYVILMYLVFLNMTLVFSILNKAWIGKIFFSYALINLVLGTTEFLLGVSVFGLNPLGDPYQIGASFWANVNTNALVVIICAVVVYFTFSQACFYFLIFLLLFYCLLVDAKIIFLMSLMQLIFLTLQGRFKVMLAVLLSTVFVTPFLIYFFWDNIVVSYLAVSSAFDLVRDDAAINALVESGSMDSIAIRAYSLNIMFDMVERFSLADWLFGVGFGTINISFYSEQMGRHMDSFSPHFFYLEMLIYSGAMFYLLYFFAIRLVSGSWCIKQIVLFAPLFAAVISISSAVYFAPLYIFFAFIAVQSKNYGPVSNHG